MADKLPAEFFKMCHLSVRSQHRIISTRGAASSDSQWPLALQVRLPPAPQLLLPQFEPIFGFTKFQDNGGILPALATVLSGMLCFELDPQSTLSTQNSTINPFLLLLPMPHPPSQGSLSTAATALRHCQEKGIHCRWEQPWDSNCSRGRVAAALKDAGAAQHVTAAHSMQVAQHNVPAPAKGHHPLRANWGSHPRDEEEPGNDTVGALSPITAHLTARLWSARTAGRGMEGKEAEVLSAVSVGVGPHPHPQQIQVCCDLLPHRNMHQP